MKTKLFLCAVTAVAFASCDEARSKNTIRTTTTTEPAAAVRTPPPTAVKDGTPAVVANPGSADQTAEANNTKINERDRGNDTLTPGNQGSSAEDTQITAAIRRRMVDDNRLSFDAKNVKVITLNKRVTLRGPVKSDEEKASIEAFAKQAEGVSVVDSQLELKK